MTKNLSILLLLVLIPAVLLAQSKRVEFHQKTVNIGTEDVAYYQALNKNMYSVLDKATTVAGDIVGFTFYDYMTNGALGQHILRFDDNTLMVGTMAAEEEATDTRGTYYNYFNGTAWLDTAVVWNRIETARKGWGNIGAFDDKTAVVVSHTGCPMNLNSGSPDAPAWIESTIPGSNIIQWPKHAVATVGDNYNIYVIGSINPSPAPFAKSTDGGTTWSSFVALADTNSPLYADYLAWGADDYMVDGLGNYVSVVGGTTQGNIMLYTSTDQGDTWTTTTVYDVAAIDDGLGDIPFDSSFFPASDYKMLGVGYPDGTCDVLVDPNGVTHVSWGNYELGYYIQTDTLHNPVRGANGELQRTFFITDYAPTAGIMYWNTGMTGGPVMAAQCEGDMLGASLWYLYRGSAGFYPSLWQSGLDKSTLGHPNMAYDASGNVFITFNGMKEGDIELLDPQDPESLSPFQHAYIVASADMGATWTAPVDMYPGVTGEDVNYPAIVNNAGDMLDILIQNDDSPGTWLQQAQHPQNKNFFVYKAIAKPLVGVNDGSVVSDFTLEQNYPNPFNPATVISYSIPSRSNVSLKVYDMLGRLVSTLVNTTQETGSYNVTFDASGLASGLYVYSLEAGTYQVSKKMMLMK